MAKDFEASEDGSANGAETHYTQCASMMLRRAKMVCQSGEYVCLIRDVSELGVGLGFIHDVPPEPRVLLQLANDLTYPVERVWTGKRQAGYRFGDNITVDDFLREQAPHQTRPLRLKIPANVRIRDGRRVLDGRLLDLSCEGAKIACVVDGQPGHLVTFELEGLPTQLAQMRWSEDGRHGLKFQQPIETEELARCAMYLQPFAAPRSNTFSRLLAKARAA